MKIYCSGQYDPGPVKKFLGKDYWFHIDEDIDPRPCWVKLYDILGDSYRGTYITDVHLRALLYDYHGEERADWAEFYADNQLFPFLYIRYQPVFESAIGRGEVLTTEELFQLADE